MLVWHGNILWSYFDVLVVNYFCNLINWLNQVRGLLIRHPEHFYVSIKGSRDTVFLREAFEDVHVPGQRQEYVLKEKHPLVLNKEKFAALMETRRITRLIKTTDALQNNPDFTQERLIPSTTALTAWWWPHLVRLHEMLHGVLQSYMHLWSITVFQAQIEYHFHAFVMHQRCIIQHLIVWTCSYGSSIDWAYPGYSNCGK